MVTIKVLEIRLELEGNRHEQEFRRLFNEAMAEFERLAAEQRWVQRMADLERGLGDRENPGGVD